MHSAAAIGPALVAGALAASAGPAYLRGHEMVAVAAPVAACPAGTARAQRVYYRANQRLLREARAPEAHDERTPPGASNPDLRAEPEGMEPERSVEVPVTVSVTLCFRGGSVVAAGADWWTDHRSDEVAASAHGSFGPGEMRIAWQEFPRDGRMRPFLSVVLPRVAITVEDRVGRRLHRLDAKLDGNAWVVDGPAPE